MNADAYYRECPHCGRRIQMRKMPSGQWVAFEGYDLVHDCQRQAMQKPPARTDGRNEKQNESKLAPYRNLAFADIVLPGSVPPTQPVVPPMRAEATNGTHAAAVAGEPVSLSSPVSSPVASPIATPESAPV